MKPLNICIFTETYYPVIGGGETQAQLLAEGLIAGGNSVILLTRRSDKSLKIFEQVGQVPVYRLAPVGQGQLKKWGLIISSIPALVKLHRQYNLIFVSGFRIVGITAVLLSKLMHKKCILKADSQGEMSGTFFKSGLEKLGFSPAFLPFKIFQILRNIILKKADGFSAITDDIVTELVDVGIPEDKIYRIPNSVDIKRFSPVSTEQKSRLRRKLHLSETSTVVIYTGRLVSYKGLPLLLRVWKEIQKQHTDACLLLVGTGGLDIHNCEVELQTYVKSNGLEQSVRFTGSVQNVHEYLQASDVFAFPSENDAFPSSIIEAMACALPVVATPVGAIKTIVTDGQNGYLVQPGEFQQLYQSLVKLISDSTLASNFGQDAWKTVQANYSAEVITEKYLAIFHNTTTASS